MSDDAAAAAAASPPPPGEDRGSYDLLCDCPAAADPDLAANCDCAQRRRKRAWVERLKSRLPSSWESWPKIKTGLIAAVVAAVLVWLVVYLVLHFSLVQ